MRLILVVAIIAVVIIFLRRNKQKKAPSLAVNDEDKIHQELKEHVHFYSRLTPEEQVSFRQRVEDFLATVTITPVGGLTITDLDKLYVASSAIIPIFSFPTWAYHNLNEVLIYPGAFTKDFKDAPENRNVLGMVGEGAMNRMMILSIQSLRNGFQQQGTGNTGIHEFVHLLDKSDGATDGIPEAMLPKEMIEPWVKYMHEAIQDIRENHSEINPYGGTNDAEFFAVISEYFFQKPELLKEHHPELMAMLETIYHQKMV